MQGEDVASSAQQLRHRNGEIDNALTQLRDDMQQGSVNTATTTADATGAGGGGAAAGGDGASFMQQGGDGDGEGASEGDGNDPALQLGPPACSQTVQPCSADLRSAGHGISNGSKDALAQLFQDGVCAPGQGNLD